MPGLVLPDAAEAGPGVDTGAAIDLLHARGRLDQSVAETLCVIAAVRIEREAAPVSAARRQLAEIYGASRLRRRLEREAAAA